MTGTVPGTVALTALTPIVWGSTYAVTTEFLPPDRPLLTALLRALPAGLVLLLLTRVLPRGPWIPKAAVLGALNIGAFFPLLFLAAYRLPGGVAAILGAAGPLFVVAFAAVLLAERPTKQKILAGVAGVFGVSLVVLRADAVLDAVGIVAGAGGAASMAAGTVLTKRWGRPEGVGALTFTGWQLTAGGLFLAPLALAVEGAPPALDLSAVAGYAWLAVVGTLIAYTLWFQGLSRLSVAPTSFLPLLSPVVATVLGWLVLNETLTWAQAGGFALALTSIVAAQLSPATARRLVGLHPRS